MNLKTEVRLFVYCTDVWVKTDRLCDGEGMMSAAIYDSFIGAGYEITLNTYTILHACYG